MQDSTAFMADTTLQATPLQFNQSSFDPVGTLFKTIGLLILLSLMLYVGVRMYRAYLQAQNGDSNRHRIKVLSTTPIAPRKSICILEALDHVLVVGMADNQMNVLLDVPVAQLSDEMKVALFQNKPQPEQRFNQLLNQWMKKQS
jgi:flagellar biogenesis protein FliO